MKETAQNIIGLEGEEIVIEVDALAEEKAGAAGYYRSLDEEYIRVEKSAPYRDVTPYTTVSGGDIDALQDLRYKKTAMQPYWDAMGLVKQYLLSDALYSGHTRFMDGGDRYFTESLPTKDWRDKNGPYLINVDDKKYKEDIDAWRYPTKVPAVAFSRNIYMENKAVQAVDIVFDKSDAMYARITDNYLRNALKRNKDKSGFQSIIQTIQQKQDDIRSLHKDKSFVVQGCAGSGKTMVLLHRLRYLIYNKDIYSEDYYFLVPSTGFKKYIWEIAAKFNISYTNVLSFQGYYRFLLDKTDNTLTDEASELVFPADYLANVYSRQFMQACYSQLLGLIVDQTNSLNEFCDDKLNALVVIEEKRVKDTIVKVKAQTVYAVQKLLGKFAQHLSLSADTYEQLAPLISAVDRLVCEQRQRMHAQRISIESIQISPDDERVQADAKLRQLNEEIEEEAARTRNAPIFTKNAHKRKLQQLTMIRDNYLGELVAQVAEQERARKEKEAAELGVVFGDVTLQAAETALSGAVSIYENAQKTLMLEEEKQNNIAGVLEERYADEIAALTQMIDESTEIERKITKWVNQLTPAWGDLKEYLAKGTLLYEAFFKYATDKQEQESVRERCKVFMRRTEREQVAYLITLLFNNCRKKIKAEYDIKISDTYKHYWYLSLYCNYLMNDNPQKARPYIFADEAQDLSPSEIELIQKINNQPVINLFGDINQVITSHGVSDWHGLCGEPEIYKLDENFRNTNQIVDFCNSSLPFKMQKIGVDMEVVEQYDTVEEALARDSIPADATFVVKDESAADDLRLSLKDSAVAEYKFYTVKEAKGLEFRQVVVIDRGMTDNEKYISYTRALAKLTVIHNMPSFADPGKKRIVEGEDVTGI